MSARDRILQRLGRGARQRASLRPGSAVPHIRPALDGALDRLFCARLEKAAASWEAASGIVELPARVQAYRERHALCGTTAIAPALAGLDWPDALQAEFGSTDGGATLAVSRALAGIAETGTLMLVSGPQTPTRLNFLPDHQIVLLNRSAIVAHLEDARARLDVMPRVVNLITGPSRTADIEQTLQLGAHGPRQLHLVLLDSDFATL